MRHIQPISGKDSLATAIVQKRRQPELSYEYLYNPTGMDLPEVDTWLSLVESYLGAPIHRVGDDLEAIMYEQKILPAHKARYCTRLSKIIPMEEWIGTEPAMVYYGIRADEKRVGYQSMSMNTLNITPVYPLKEEGYTLPMVWNLVTELDLLPPQFFWNSLHEMVIKRLGNVAHELLVGLKPWEFNMLFSWRTRPNCYHCFYQSLWELVGLLEHHPGLFWHAEQIETEIGGADQREKAFSLKQNWPLRKIAEHAESIKKKRCIAICKLIAKKAQIEMVFDDEPTDDEPDYLSVVPCGLFCGK
jgi:3'-phosphoadenosine 5'-phosphosulfate sulfotransferase (PAPS reductase)/FAD synthetase